MLVTQSTAMGGMEMHVQYLAAELVARRVRVSMVFPRDEAFDELSARCSRLNAKVTRLDTDGRNGRRSQFLSWLRYVRWGREQHPDIVHIHTGGATGGLAVAAASKWVFRATVIRTEHDVPIDVPDVPLKLSSWLTDVCCDAVVAVSRRNAGLRRERLRKPRNFAAVLNGVPVPPGSTDPDRRSATRAALGISPEELVVGSVVRLAEGKGLTDLLRAFALISTRTPRRLLLVGARRVQLAELDRDVVLAHAEEAADGDHDGVDAAFLVDHQLLDVADLFVLAVIDIEADELGALPLAGGRGVLLVLGGGRFCRRRHFVGF